MLPHEQPRITSTLVGDDRVTAVNVQLWLGGWTFEATGSAKTHPNDYPNSEVGEALAFSRAFRDLSRQLRDFGYDLDRMINSGGTAR